METKISRPEVTNVENTMLVDPDCCSSSFYVNFHSNDNCADTAALLPEEDTVKQTGGTTKQVIR